MIVPRLAFAAALAASLGACANVDRTVATSSIPTDFRERHPIVLAQAPQRLDVFRSGDHGLDPRQRADVRQFAKEYKAAGTGRITALVPKGAIDSVSVHATLDAIRRELTTSGVGGTMEVGAYEVSAPELAAPIRLTFDRLQAKVSTRCGEWPEDLNSGSSLDTFENKPYYNFGCATRNNLAAQVDDPRDLVRPRVEDPADVQMRTRAIGNVRQGIDPGTGWTTHGSAISSIGQ